MELREISGQRAIVTLFGKHDLSTRQLLTEQLERARMVPIVIIDLTPCSSLDATTLVTLLKARDASLAQRVEVVMPGCGETVDRPLQMTRMRAIFTTYASLEEALAKAQPPRPNL